MPVYNTPIAFLREAVDSILDQSFHDFEFIIIDDGSTNESKDYLDGLTDPRIRIMRNETNIGVTKSLNIGFQAAQGNYIARMDADDISLPKRFEKQFAFMESHPDVIVCGTRTVNLGESTAPVRSIMEDMSSYRVRMLFSNPGPVHPTAFFRRNKLEQYHIWYDEQLIYAQDYGMWMTLSQYGSICILPEVLLYYRDHTDQISKTKRELQIQCDQTTQKKLLLQLLGSVTQEEAELHYIHSTGYYADATISPKVKKWYDHIISENNKKRIYDRKILKRHILGIECRLVYNSLTEKMSKTEKTLLFFRYLPFPMAAKNVFQIIKGKLQKCKN